MRSVPPAGARDVESPVGRPRLDPKAAARAIGNRSEAEGISVRSLKTLWEPVGIGMMTGPVAAGDAEPKAASVGRATGAVRRGE